MAQVKKSIDQGFSDNIKVADIAKRLNLSREYLSRIFTHEIGKSPKQYLIDLQMDKVLCEINFQESSVTQACFEAGFQDLSNFLHRFRKGYQAVPSEFKIGAQSRTKLDL